jgi:hypothetical protein
MRPKLVGKLRNKIMTKEYKKTIIQNEEKNGWGNQ